jgi:hypothetical protein
LTTDCTYIERLKTLMVDYLRLDRTLLVVPTGSALLSRSAANRLQSRTCPAMSVLFRSNTDLDANVFFPARLQCGPLFPLGQYARFPRSERNGGRAILMCYPQPSSISRGRAVRRVAKSTPRNRGMEEICGN